MSKFGLSEEPLLLGLDFAKDVYNKAMSKGVSKIVLKGDPDVDGYLALYVAMQLFQGIRGNYQIVMNDNRLHGMMLNEKYKDTLFINLDSGITEDELVELVEDGNYVISLDHHELEYKDGGYGYLIKHESTNGCSGVIINNQYEESPNEYKFWSGTGVTLQGLCYILDKEPTEELIACHGISLLSDIREIESLEARELLEFTYNVELGKCRMLFNLVRLVLLGEDERYKEIPEKLDRNFVDYKLSPYINAAFQLNKGNYLIKLLVSGKVPYFLDAKAFRRRIFEVLEERVKVLQLKNITVLMLDDLSEIDLSDVDKKKIKFDYVLTNFIGVFANKYLNKGKTVMIVAKNGNEWARGSVRGFYSNVDYKTVFKEIGFLAEGHLGAFGLLGITKQGLDFKELDRRVGEIEQQGKVKPPIVVMNNLLEELDEIKKIAYENQFKLSKNYTKILYTGISQKYVRGNEKYREYEVDGLSVMTFSPEIPLDECYLEPVKALTRLEIYAKPR